MALRFYMDVHIRRSITEGLRKKGVDVVTAQEDNCAELSDPELSDPELSDPELLARASELSRVLFSMDDDLLTEATLRQTRGVPFAGVVYAHQLRITVGQAIRDLQLMSEVYNADDIANRVEFLPL